LEAQERGTPQWLANAKAEIEQTRQKADALSRQVAGQSAANDKLQAELDNLRAGINAYWQQVVRNLCS
jgi:peptidoglycan hydrolase CwlO-like protein